MQPEKLPVVLIPGLQSDHRSWSCQIPFLEALGHEVIVPKGQHRLDSIAAMAECVAEQVPPVAHVLAWSMGGYIACRLLELCPERIASLGMIATSARPEDEARTEQRRLAMAQARREGMAATHRANLATSCHDLSRVPDRLLQELIAMAVEIGIEAFIAQQEAIIARPDGRAALAAWTGPLMILVGEEDVTTPPDRAEEMHALRPDSRLFRIPAAGHCAPFEVPDQVNAILGEWLAQVEADSPR